MKLRNMLLCGVAATALGLAAALPTNSSILPSLTTPAQAQVQASVSIGFGTFYDSLSPHGDWVRLDGRNVWVPGDVRADWRPYTVGRWAYTRPHGWTWVSDEPYGWAVYHYGRWGFHHAMGWYWVPDTVWAPAWVTWRGSGEYAAWAPMPPRGLVGISYEVDPYVIPARYWVAVPTAQFLAPNLFNVAIHIGEPRFYDVVRHTRPIGHVRVVNNITVNNYFDIDYIERQTGEEVRVRDIREAREPGAIQLGDDAIEIYAPAVEEEPDAEPQQVRTEEEVVEKRGVDVAAEPADEQADQPIEVAEDAPELPEEAVNREGAPVSDDDVAEDTEAEDALEAAEGEQPADMPEAAEGEQPADTPEAAEGEQPADKPEAAQDEQPADLPEAAQDEQPADMPEAAQGEQPAEMPEAAESAQPEAPAIAAEPETAPQVEERAIGEPAEQGQGQGQGQGQEQPQQRGQGQGQGQGQDRDDEEQLPQ
jgi:hypothetical protein